MVRADKGAGMTDDEKLKIRLAEAMGWTGIEYIDAKTARGWYGCPPGVKNEINEVGNGPHKEKIPDPEHNLMDQLAAVEAIFPEKCSITFRWPITTSPAGRLFALIQANRGEVYSGRGSTKEAALWGAFRQWGESTP